jgi:hypothetical protein
MPTACRRLSLLIFFLIFNFFLYLFKLIIRLILLFPCAWKGLDNLFQQAASSLVSFLSKAAPPLPMVIAERHVVESGREGDNRIRCKWDRGKRRAMSFIGFCFANLQATVAQIDAAPTGIFFLYFLCSCFKYSSMGRRGRACGFRTLRRQHGHQDNKYYETRQHGRFRLSDG